MRKARRIYQIDLFRFIAAMMVVMYHYAFRGYRADNMSILEFPEIGGYFKYGYLGVDLFFIISGFVIILSIKEYSLSTFLKSRIIRLYPAYWFCLTVTFLVMLIWGGINYSVSIKQFLVNTTMFQGLFGVRSVDGVYWSLLVELKFYIIIAVYMVLRKIRRFDLNVLILFWLVLSCLPVFIDFNSFFITKILGFVFILNYSSYFIAGMLFYKIYKEGSNLIYVLGLLVCVCLSIHHGILQIDFLQDTYGAIFSPLAISLHIASFYIIMYLTCCQKLNILNSPKLIKLGILTYPLYLLHQNIGYILFNTIGVNVNKYVLLITVILFMLFFSYLVNVFIEKPFSQYLKSRIERIINILKRTNKIRINNKVTF